MADHKGVFLILSIAVLGSMQFSDEVHGVSDHIVTQAEAGVHVGVDAAVAGVPRDEAFTSVDNLRRAGEVSSTWVSDYKKGFDSVKN